MSDEAEIRIRRARNADHDRILEMVLRLATEIVGKETSAPLEKVTREDLAQALSGESDELLLVAQKGDSLVGCARIRVLPYHPMYRFSRSAEYGYVEWMFVHPEQRGRGLARKMLAELEAWAVERGLGQVTLHYSPKAEGLYASCGYKMLPEMGKSLPAGEPPKCV